MIGLLPVNRSGEQPNISVDRRAGGELLIPDAKAHLNSSLTLLCSSLSGGLSAGQPHRQLPGAAVGPSPSAPSVGGHLPGAHLAELRPGAMVWRSRQRAREALHPAVGSRPRGDASDVGRACLSPPGPRAGEKEHKARLEFRQPCAALAMAHMLARISRRMLMRSAAAVGCNPQTGSCFWLQG